MIIAIDGTSGSGKSTAARLLAENFNLNHLNTGSLYRWVTFHCLKKNLNPKNTKKIILLCRNCDFDSIDHSILHDEKISQTVAQIAQIPKVRSIIREYQKQYAIGKNIVMEGRDIGTVVFPKADLKFFITASAKERAKRRYQQLLKNNKNVIYEKIEKNIKERDEKDKTRRVSPLKISKQAIYIDTTSKSIDEVFKILCEKYKEYLENKK